MDERQFRRVNRLSNLTISREIKVKLQTEILFKIERNPESTI